MPRFMERVRGFKLILILLVAGFVCVLYSHFTAVPPVSSPGSGAVFGALSGDLPGYSRRFFLSFLLMGIIPLVTALMLGHSPGDLGFRFPISPFRPRLFLLLAGGAVLAGYASSLSPDIASVYPYSRTMIGLFREKGVSILFLHGTAYFLFYYVPWEFFFRGFLVFPFIQAVQPGYDTSLPLSPVVLAVASFQIVPSAMLHFGHPLSESLGAIVFGLCAGWFAVKTRSILPGLVFHAVVGISLDFFLFLKAG